MCRGTLCGVPVNKGLRPSHLHLMTGDLHAPAPGLGLDLAQPHGAQLCPTCPLHVTVMPWMEPMPANLTCTALSPESHPWAPQRQSCGEGQENGIAL